MRPGRSLVVPSTQPPATTAWSRRPRRGPGSARAKADRAGRLRCASSASAPQPAAAGHRRRRDRFRRAARARQCSGCRRFLRQSRRAPAPLLRRSARACSELTAWPLTTPTGAIPVEAAKLESDEDAEQIAKVGRPAARAEPVSAAQAEALSPALGPAIEVAATPDPTDYSIGKDDTIKVATEETLGHYADWLGTSAATPAHASII